MAAVFPPALKNATWKTHKSALESANKELPKKLKALEEAVAKDDKTATGLSGVATIAAEVVEEVTKVVSKKKKPSGDAGEWFDLLITQSKKFKTDIDKDAIAASNNQAIAKAQEFEAKVQTADAASAANKEMMQKEAQDKTNAEAAKKAQADAASQANKEMMQKEARKKLLAAMPSGNPSGSVLKTTAAILDKAGLDISQLGDVNKAAVEYDRAMDTVAKLIELKPKAKEALASNDATKQSTVEVYKKIQELAKGQMQKAHATALTFLKIAGKWQGEAGNDAELEAIVNKFGVLCNQLDVTTRVEQSTVLKELKVKPPSAPGNNQEAEEGESEDQESPYNTHDMALLKALEAATSFKAARDALVGLGVPEKEIDDLQDQSNEEDAVALLKKHDIPDKIISKVASQLVP